MRPLLATAGESKHKAQRSDFAYAGCRTWLVAEREPLWHEISSHTMPFKRKKGVSAANRHCKCKKLYGENAHANSCVALIFEPPLDQTRPVMDKLNSLHSKSTTQVDISWLGTHNATLVPNVDRDLI